MPHRQESFPFNEVDEAFAHAAHPDGALGIEFEVGCTNRLDEVRIRAAIDVAARLHPLAGARQMPWDPAAGGYRWEIVGQPEVDALRVVECPTAADLQRCRDDFQSLSVPLDRSPPFRVLLARHPAGDALMLNVSHTASDGIGVLRLLRSIVRAYAGDSDPVEAHDLARVRTFADSRPPARPMDWLQRWQRLHQTQVDAWLAPPSRIATDEGSNRPGYGIHHLRVPAGISGALRPKRFHPGTMNDLLLAAVTLAIDRWNRSHGVASDRIAVLVPVNLRPQGSWKEVVSNVSMSAAVSTRPEDRADPSWLMRRIVSQTRQIKEAPEAAVLMDVYRSAFAMPAAWRQGAPALFGTLAGDRYMPTVLMTNLGHIREPLSFGPEGGATELWGSPPCRMPMGIGIGVFTYDDALHLSFRYRHPQCSAPAMQRFADEFVEALRFLG